ncbi:ATPase inhibitor mai-2, mitochondrial [Halyomorpha halys]|uniref:ATPase inhibitor mai-2, mitochondrial n=1 Tax=Halyomorpha halys TaxID=286706 RepID=UPI0006D4FA15|nr:ATPase inhibitor mai-2, mitochondrial-like [Halyomorpha halys]
MNRFLLHIFRPRLSPKAVGSNCTSELSTGLGDPGSGAGKGGGGGGSIRNTGGAFGKREAAFEGEYFHKMQKKQLQKLKEMLETAEGDLEKAKEAVKKTKQRIKNIKKGSDDDVEK